MTVCYLCGIDGADTTEHVVPRCVYPGKLPADVITLPAHRRCADADVALRVAVGAGSNFGGITRSPTDLSHTRDAPHPAGAAP